MTFLNACLRGQCSPSDVYEWVERWEHEAAMHTPLADYLGLTADEYTAWVDGRLSMVDIVESRTRSDSHTRSAADERRRARCP